MTLRWYAGRTGTERHSCFGDVCYWSKTGIGGSAAYFQAFAKPGSGGPLVHSNVVDVGFAAELAGSYRSWFENGWSSDCKVAFTSGEEVALTNQYQETATGMWNPDTREIVLTAGWPSITPGHPLIGKVSFGLGPVRIDWPNLPPSPGHPNGESGGYWEYTGP